MAGRTLTILTQNNKGYKAAVSSANAGAPSVGSPQFLYDSTEKQHDLLQAVEKLKQYIIENVKLR